LGIVEFYNLKPKKKCLIRLFFRQKKDSPSYHTHLTLWCNFVMQQVVVLLGQIQILLLRFFLPTYILYKGKISMHSLNLQFKIKFTKIQNLFEKRLNYNKKKVF